MSERGPGRRSEGRKVLEEGPGTSWGRGVCRVTERVSKEEKGRGGKVPEPLGGDGTPVVKEGREGSLPTERREWSPVLCLRHRGTKVPVKDRIRRVWKGFCGRESPVSDKRCRVGGVNRCRRTREK